MESRCNFLVIPLKSILFPNLSQKFRRTVILLFLIVSQILGVSSYATAQQIAVKGTVKDQKGESLIGVTVQVKGSNTAVATDIKGNFSLANVPVKASLVFSYIGMESKTVPLNSRTQIDVVLKERATTLDDVVVVGYQEIKRTNTSASIVSVQSKGCERSRRRPPHISARSTMFRTSSAVNSKFVSSLLPARAMKMRSGELIQTSSIVGSLI